METRKYAIPDEILTPTIELLRETQLRLELEATALLSLDSPQSCTLAQERLEQALTARKLFEFYLNL